MKFCIYIIVYFIQSTLFSININGVIQFDSAIVKTIRPSESQEQKVFKEVNLDFAKKVENENIGLWDRFWNWILELLVGKSDYETKQNALSIIIWILVSVGLILIIWILTRTSFINFLKGNSKNIEFNFSDIDEDILTINFNDRIKKAIDVNDFRLAIRWLYLKQLFILNQQKIINYLPFKTNIDYTFEISKTTYQTAFIEISRIYDYVWYGKYLITKIDYHNFEEKFNQFEKSINA